MADLELSGATFARPDLTRFCRLDELGLAVTGQRVKPDRAVLACRVVEPDQGAVAVVAKAYRATR